MSSWSPYAEFNAPFNKIATPVYILLKGSLFSSFLNFKKITFSFQNVLLQANHIRWWCYCLTGAVKNLIESFGILTLMIYTTLYVYGRGIGHMCCQKL